MFTTKKTALIERKKETPAIIAPGAVQKAVVGTNRFLQKGLKKSAETRSGNNALKYSTTGNDFVDQFGVMGSYKVPREYALIEKDCAALWGNNPRLAVCFILFLRLITRTISLWQGSKTSAVQRGSGLKYEGIMRMMWLHVNHPEVFWKNIGLFIAVGSWKDIFVMLSLDLQYNGWEHKVLDWDKMKQLILAGLENPATSNLVKKYLPQIRATKKCVTVSAQADTLIAKWIMAGLYTPKSDTDYKGYKMYRTLKTSGTAHIWQQLISKRRMLEISFDSIHGRALAQLVSGKFLANNKLEKLYEAWIDSRPVAKFTGYVPELIVNVETSPKRPIHIKTFNAQFEGLVQTAKAGAAQATRFITVVDTSGSMDSQAHGIKLTNMFVAKSMALFFSRMLDKGPFAKSWYNFSDRAVIENVKGTTPYEQWQSIKDRSLCCSTDFQAVVEHFCDIKIQNPDILDSEFPNGFLVLSDMEFNSVIGPVTNTQKLLKQLKRAGFSDEFVANFKLVYWHLTSYAYNNTAGKKFETYGNVPNVFYFSGYDGSIIAFLTGLEGDPTKPQATPRSAEELFEAAMDQEVLRLVEV